MIQKYAALLVIALTMALSASIALPPAEALAEQCERVDPSANAAERNRAEPGTGTTSNIPADEVEGLQWMREEEKLARDVYLALYDVWQVKIFKNISRAESAHMRAVKSLLQFYAIDDPAADNARGEFINPAIQDLYDSLVVQGSKSLIDALEVGAYVEELDILDLQERASYYRRIQRVYTNLESGSQNHLGAFVKSLARHGVEYSPKLMTVEQFEAIVGTSATTNPPRRGRNRGGRSMA